MTVAAGDDPTRTLEAAERAIDELEGRISRHWTTFKDKRVQTACADVDLVYDFVKRCLRKAEVAEPISTAVRADESYAARFADIHATVKDFGACLIAIDGAGATAFREKLVADLTALSIRLRGELSAAVDAFVAVAELVEADAEERTNARRVANEIRQQLKARQLLQEAADAREELQKVTGDVSAGELGTHYADHATKEAQAADWLRYAVIVLLGGVTVYAVWASVLHPEVSYNAVLLRLSVTIPVAVLAAYLARESGKHRRSAQNARELAMAMHTLPAYVAELAEKGTELRMVLGQRVFGPAAQQIEPQAEDDLPQALDTLQDVLRRVRELTERREGRQ